MKRALLVGVNNYRDPQINDLNGCVNDVLNMRSILKDLFGFEDAGIHVLTDERATAVNIMDRLHDLTNMSKPGDVLVFHFSGHGSQMCDRSGDEISDELDEVICPHDKDWNDEETFITDDVLAEVFEGVGEGMLMEVFLDCCHSGTGTREIQRFFEPQPLTLTERTQNRYTPPPIDILCRSMDSPELPAKKLFIENQYLSNPVLWSGCKSNQTSADAWIDKRYNGAFTWHLCDIIRRSPGDNRADILRQLRGGIQQGGFNQHPELETRHHGKLNSKLFE